MEKMKKGDLEKEMEKKLWGKIKMMFEIVKDMSRSGLGGIVKIR